MDSIIRSLVAYQLSPLLRQSKIEQFEKHKLLRLLLLLCYHFHSFVIKLTIYFYYYPHLPLKIPNTKHNEIIIIIKKITPKTVLMKRILNHKISNEITI